MKIVVLDGYCAKGEELDFDFLNRFGEVDYFDRTDQADVLSRAKDADIVLLNKVNLDGDTMAQCKNHQTRVRACNGV